MREQKGFIFRASGGWYVKYRENVLENGKPVRKLKTHRLADVDDHCMTESQARKLAKEFLKPFNEGKITPASAMTLDEFVDVKYGGVGGSIKGYWEYAGETELSPATVYGYKRTYADYLQPAFGSMRLRDIKRAEVLGYLLSIYHERGRRVARSAKAVGSAIFASLSASEKALWNAIHSLASSFPTEKRKSVRQLLQSRLQHRLQPFKVSHRRRLRLDSDSLEDSDRQRFEDASGNITIRKAGCCSSIARCGELRRTARRRRTRKA